MRYSAGDWQYLMLRRVPERGGFWQGVTGGVEEGERLIDAARREVMEETGLRPNTIIPIDYSCTFPLEERWKQLYAEDVDEIVEHVFVACTDGATPTPSDEHDAWRRCGVDEAVSLPDWEQTIEALTRCHRLLQTQMLVEWWTSSERRRSLPGRPGNLARHP